MEMTRYGPVPPPKPWLYQMTDIEKEPVTVNCPQAGYVIAQYASAQLVGTAGKAPSGAQLAGFTVFGSLTAKEMANPYIKELL